MELQNLDIDRYIDWYKQLSTDAELHEDNTLRYNRLCMLSYWLFRRHILDSKNIKSKTLADNFAAVALDLQRSIESIKQIALENGNKLYHFPASWEWNDFDRMRSSGLQSSLDYLKEKVSQSALSELDILKEELQWRNEDGSDFWNYYTTGTPFLNNSSMGSNSESWAIMTGIDVSNIDYCRWIARRIKELESNKIEHSQTVEIQSAPLLQWNVPSNVLYTMFFDLLECKAITWCGKGDEGDKMEIARMLCRYFVDKDGDQLSIETIKQALKPSTQKAQKRIDVTKIALLVKSESKKT